MTSRRNSNDQLVRRIYEERPYPAVDESIVRRPAWRVAPLEWINALWRSQPEQITPERILVAGCGTGAEAFAMRRRFPAAEIVAIDFSPRSISIAKRLQRQASQMRPVHFHVADLSNRNLPRTIGGDFDFISCHGVLSYVPAPGRGLANMARCLGPDGVLYLGVNGATHASVAGREFLRFHGFDVTEFRGGVEVRRVLKLFDALRGGDAPNQLAGKKPGYLAGDLFGPVIHNLPQAHWLRMAAAAGLHFQGSSWGLHAMRDAVANSYLNPMIPSSRAEVCALVEIVHPAAFHQLIFTRRPANRPAWSDLSTIMSSKVVWTGLYFRDLPKRRGSWNSIRRLTLKSPPTNSRLEWQIPEWELEILRQSTGQRAVGDILADVSIRVPWRLLQEQLYTLHQLIVVTVLP
jgi:SAM-dependent methyltransferase